MIGLDIIERRLYIPGGDTMVIPAKPSIADGIAYIDEKAKEGTPNFNALSMPDYPPISHNRKIWAYIIAQSADKSGSSRFFRLLGEGKLVSPDYPASESRVSFSGTLNGVSDLVCSPEGSEIDIYIRSDSRGRWSLGIVDSPDCACIRDLEGGEFMEGHNLEESEYLSLVLGALAYNHKQYTKIG